MLVIMNVNDRVDVDYRDNHPVDMLVTTNHMVETDKLQSEVGMCGRIEMVGGVTLLSVCLDIKFEETAGTEGPGTHGEGQTGKKFAIIFERGIST